MKRVLCINAKPIEGHGNDSLHLLQEGKDYEVIEVNEEGNYNIGVKPDYCIKNNVECFWGKDRFLECQEDDHNEITD